MRSGPTGIIHNYGEHNYSAFVQDDYKVSSRLTINLGVRWEFDGTYNDKYGNLTNVWPALMGTVRGAHVALSLPATVWLDTWCRTISSLITGNRPRESPSIQQRHADTRAILR